MTKRNTFILGFFSCLAVLCGPDRLPAQDHRYIVNHVDTPPEIDGMLTADDEWSAASEAAGDWILLRSNNLQNDAPDQTNNRFEALWGDDGLYIRHQVDLGGWDERGIDAMDFGYENINMYFDPNTDGETNDQTGPNDTGVDGYQLAFNEPLGESEISPTELTAGMFSEAHVNALFGNQGAPWSMFENIVMKQTTSIDPPFGYTELFIPWEDFDATNPDEGFDPEFDDIGLYHPEPPVDGEEWFFNIARIQTDGLLPAWASPPGANFFATRPHGVLQFSLAVTNPCDINQDGTCDAADIDLLSAAVRAGDTESRFDLNGDGAVNADDRFTWISDLMNTYIGDSNLDGVFTTADFLLVFQKGEFEDAVAGNSGWEDGDWNGDADFTSGDFLLAFQEGGFEKGPRAAVMAVPEPTSLLLSSLGLLSLLAVRRRRYVRR